MDRASADAPSDARARGTVAVHEAPSDAGAREVAARLLGAGVPAAVEAARADAAWVIVPWDRQDDAEQLLRGWGLAVLPRFGAGGDFEAALPGRERLRALSVVTDEAPPPRLEEDDAGPIEPPLPDSGPLVPRLVVAMAAIGFGLAVQRLLEAVFGMSGAAEAMAARGAPWAEPWRLVTAGFYHFSLMHLASNMAFGLVFGVVLFGTHGVGATMLAWVVATAVGMSIEVLGSPAGVLVAGASAGNYGLVGLWAKGQADRARRAFLPRRDRLAALGIVLVLAPGALTPVTSTGTKVAVLAHAGGFLAGALAGLLFERKVAFDALERVEARSRVAQWIALGCVLAAFAAAARAWTAAAS